MDEVGDTAVNTVLWHNVVRSEGRRREQAWRELVDHNSALVWGAARAYSANNIDAEDVYQATWLLLAENIGTLREPEALPGWLVTTTKREAVRLAKARRREAPAELDTVILDAADPGEGPENQALRSVAAARMWQAFGTLSHRCQQLLRVMAVAPEASYTQVSEALGLPKGSIGPKKGRCLRLLRERMVSTPMPEEAAG